MEFFHFCNGLCYNWQEAITLNSFHIIPFYWVVWSLFSIKDLKEFRNGFFFCPAISFSCRALGGLFQPDVNRQSIRGMNRLNTRFFMVFLLQVVCLRFYIQPGRTRAQFSAARPPVGEPLRDKGACPLGFDRAVFCGILGE